MPCVQITQRVNDDTSPDKLTDQRHPKRSDAQYPVRSSLLSGDACTHTLDLKPGSIEIERRAGKRQNVEEQNDNIP